ncbi:hypothetical protein [Clostridioides sp. ZZV15-6597]|uniref:hypothetical protein n=1 Tax=Clostridioides sp. ZZV15-6597 TaxID=2811500 RepID=UPI001D10F732|nr:hypothetical protein [Clostridioides sp. ZZV15-6597]
MQKAYKNENMEKSYCIFLDLLGFSKEVLQNCKDNRGQEHLLSLLKALKMAMSKFENNEEYSMKVFTDNIVIGVPLKRITELSSWCPEDEINEYGGYASGDILSEIYENYFNSIINQVIFYQLEMMLNKFFVRGGWSCGHLYMDSKIVYGDALIFSHDLESQKAIYPRIILSDELKEMVERMIYNKAELVPFPYNRKYEIHGNPTIPQLLKAEDEIYFVNYLFETIEWENKSVNFKKIQMHKEIIIEMINTYSEDTRILEKYCWSAFYHNKFCEYFIGHFLGQKIDNELLITDIPYVDEKWSINWIVYS